MRISDWSSDVCSSDLARQRNAGLLAIAKPRRHRIHQFDARFVNRTRFWQVIVPAIAVTQIEIGAGQRAGATWRRPCQTAQKPPRLQRARARDLGITAAVHALHGRRRYYAAQPQAYLASPRVIPMQFPHK